jgi:hypothetical protein
MNSTIDNKGLVAPVVSSRNPRPLSVWAFFASTLLMLAIPTLSFAQAPTSLVLPGCTQSLTTRISVYDFLAYVAYREFQRTKYEDAGTAAKALEFIWDKTSGCMEHFGVNKQETQKVDELMDLFVKPLEFDSSKADPKTVAEAYERFIHELDVAENSTIPKN